MKKCNVAIVGVTGYTGYELMRLLLSHPFVDIVKVMASEMSRDKPIEDIHPALRSVFHMTCEGYRRERLSDHRIDIAFTATPNEVSARIVPEILDAEIKVIDLSGAFRLKDPHLYSRWYGFEHEHPNLLLRSVYGLSELYAKSISAANLVANPGCYPTSILLPLIPLLEADLIDTSHTIICDAKSGVTGAGKVLNAANLFAEVNENFKAYNVLTHRHAPEIRQELRLDRDSGLIFTPHLLPINRGILATIYARAKRAVTHADVMEIYANKYAGKQFIRLYEMGQWPEIKHVTGTNYCDIGWAVSDTAKDLVIISAIDNLVKGAAGQAVQNLNLMCGFEEALGIADCRRNDE